MTATVFIPYSRQYVMKKYASVDFQLLNLYEADILPKFLNKVSGMERVDKVIICSNDLDGLIISARSKLQVITRSENEINFVNRKQIIHLAHEKLRLCSFILINPLFPLLSISTVGNIMTEMHRSKCNIFLGHLGSVRMLTSKDTYCKETEAAWDFGAVSAFFDCTIDRDWRNYASYSALETLSIRNVHDFKMIKTLQSMGY